MAQGKGAARKSKSAEEKDPEVKIESALGRTEKWFERNWKMLTTVAVVLLVVAGGIYAYHGLYRVPRGKKAGEAMFVAQQLLQQGDYATALNGDGNNLGFAEVADTYGNTSQGRLAAHYAGICYMKQGDRDSALDYLSKYKATKGVPNRLVNAENEGLKADIYADMGDYSQAADHYRKAVDAGDNSYATPMYLKKLGLALEASGNYAEALKAYRRIADEYATSTEAHDIEKFASAAEQKL